MGHGSDAKKNLIVEDTEDARDYMESVLQLAGFDVAVAKDGIEGLEMARSEMPDLIVTDISMPRLNGFQLIQKIRSTSNQKDLPILAITSHGTDMAMEAIRTGADRALARPVANHLLVAFVSDLLRKGK